MSHIFTDDGKQWKLIPVMPVKPIIPDNPNNIIGLGISEQAQYAGRLEAAKANALPVVNPELIGDTKKLSFIADKGDPFYEWPGTWEKTNQIINLELKTVAKLIAPQQPQAEYKCQTCGASINEGEFKTFAVCDNCYDASYKKQTAMTQSDAPNEGREEKHPYFLLSKNEHGKMWLFYNPGDDGRYNCWEPIKEKFYAEFEQLLSLRDQLSKEREMRKELVDGLVYALERLKDFDIHTDVFIESLIAKASELDKNIKDA